jgi:hypothetical protein
VHALQRVEGTVVGTLGLGAEAQVVSEPGFLFLEQGFGDSGFGAFVVAADVFPKVAVDAADSLQLPGGVGELCDEDSFVGVGRLVCILQAALELCEFGGVLEGEQVWVGGFGGGFIR